MNKEEIKENWREYAENYRPLDPSELYKKGRADVLAEIEGKMSETIDNYFEGLLIIPAPELTKVRLKGEILKVIREVGDK